MKRKLTERYICVFSISIAVIIAVWMLLTYVLLLSGNVENDNAPQYLVHRFEQYVEISDEVKMNEEGKAILLENDLWAQVIDGQGTVLASYHTPEGIPDAYNVFEITNYSLNSNTLGNQTIFLSGFQEWSEYGVLIGCDSARVSKMSVKFTGGMAKTILKSGCILVIVFLIVGLCAGLFFSRNISAPVNDIIECINGLETDQVYQKRDRNDSIFQSVFDSLDKLQLRLESADVERKHAEEQRAEWITNISHDIKTPLSTINGYAEIMADDEYTISDAERKRYSGKILKNTEVIQSLIEELKFGRMLETGGIKVQKEEVNLCRLLKDCCNDIPANLRAGSVTFDFEREAVYAQIDKQLMRRCLMNIISNAIIHNNSRVDIMIKCYQTEHTVIEISDNGKGMPHEELDNVFKRYYRGTSSKEIAGSGLGLAIAKEIVMAHGGDISVKSEEGKGCVFTISL